MWLGLNERAYLFNEGVDNDEGVGEDVEGGVEQGLSAVGLREDRCSEEGG